MYFCPATYADDFLETFTFARSHENKEGLMWVAGVGRLVRV